MKRQLDSKISEHFGKYKDESIKNILNQTFKNRYPQAKVRLVTADNFY